MKAHPALFAGRGGAKNERLLFQSTIDLHILNIFQLTVNIHFQNMRAAFISAAFLSAATNQRRLALCAFTYSRSNIIYSFKNENYEHRRIEFIFLVQYSNSYSVFLEFFC